ncbi:indole-3-glycerol phosphate synthase TrpC (plasmid) [Enterococcus sp. 22-H-5-01]|uniref:indole-3-glycerol phosphate synthase TrpC n=1 Tax=Enterococcus sp. 22-H-5-01 TaxID=3418555 RepID=UPI003CFD7ED5
MDFLTKILAEKKYEIESLDPVEKTIIKVRPSFYDQVKSDSSMVHIIGEIKRASPSKGAINEYVDILAQARQYEQAGVSAISVLTDPVFFKGHINDLAAVATAVDLPILCKDFIIDERQILRAKQAGASIILLIVAALSQERLKELYRFATEQGLEVLVEVHDIAELQCAQLLGAKIIGVNNRNLKTFQVSIETSVELKQAIGETIFISESGFKNRQDIEKILPYYQGVLIGETLMTTDDPMKKIKELKGLQ